MALLQSSRLPTTFILVVFAALAGLSAAGCQQAGMADAPPLPNFGRSALLRPAPAQAPAPVAVAPQPAPAKPPHPDRAATLSGIPREWVATATPNAWRWIVIHHSATAIGGAMRFDKEHRDVRHFDELGYHFVIGNGTDTPDGKVEVGPRWPKQKWGAHAQTPDEQFNRFGIGICLVGNFDQQHPSDAQLRSTAKLVAYLMKTYNIPPSHVIGHGDTKPTDCPGRNVHVAALRRMSVQMLADAGVAVPQDRPIRTAVAAGRELMFKAPAR
jgi:hypothetical protein